MRYLKHIQKMKGGLGNGKDNYKKRGATRKRKDVLYRRRG